MYLAYRRDQLTCDVCGNPLAVAENGNTIGKQTMLYFKRVAIIRNKRNRIESVRIASCFYITISCNESMRVIPFK